MKITMRIVSLVMVVIIAFSMFSLTASAKTKSEFMLEMLTDVNLSYEDDIKNCFYPEFFDGNPDIWYYYNMLYAHCENTQTEPEYVVFIAKTYTCNEDAFVDRYVGDCLVVNSEISLPYDLAHYVYVPSDKTVYTLEEAYNNEELDISAAMRSGRVGMHRGDIDLNRSCDILDATIIQMHLANMDIDNDIKTGRMDLDGSDDVSILDVTKLQRYLVGLENSLRVKE